MSVAHYAGVTTSSVATAEATVYRNEGEDQLMKVTSFDMFVKHIPFPRNSGQTMQFHRWDVGGSDMSTTPENDIGTSLTMGNTTFTMSLSWYARFIVISSRVKAVDISSTMMEVIRQMGASRAYSVDNIIKAVLDGSAASVQETVLGLTMNRRTAGKITSMMQDEYLEPPEGFDDTFPMVMSPLTIFDFVYDPSKNGMLDLAKQGSEKSILRKMAKRGKRVLVTADSSIYSSHNVTTVSTTKRRIYIFAKGCLAAPTLVGWEYQAPKDPKYTTSFNLIVKQKDPKSTSDISDPANKISGTVAYHDAWGVDFLDPQNLRYRVIDAEATLAA